MLIARHTKFFARAFANAARLGATATNFRIVSESLADDRLLPMQVTEQGPAGVTQRIGFQDITGGFQVIVGSDSIYAQHLPPSGTLSAFLTRAGEVIERLLPLLPQAATRVALIQEGQAAISTPEDVAIALLRFPPSFSASVPFEWDWRGAMRSDRTFGGTTEAMNTVVTFHRAAGRHPWGEPFDGVIAELDINTVPENLTPRFQAADCRAFFEAGIAWHERLAQELAEFIRRGPAS
jgi:hypothetical protein